MTKRKEQYPDAAISAMQENFAIDMQMMTPHRWVCNHCGMSYTQYEGDTLRDGKECPWCKSWDVEVREG